MNTTVKQWLHGLAAAAIGAASSAVPTMIVDPATFNLHGGLGKLGEVVLLSALVAVAAYLKQSPLPGSKGE